MAMVVCNDGLVAILLALQSTLNTYVLRLYQNNHTPVKGDTAGSYTEANFTGYASVSLNSWGVPFLNGSNRGEIDHPNAVFTQTGTGTTCNVYGYYVTDGSGNLVWAEINGAGPFNMNQVGLTYTVTPVLTDDDL